MKSVLLYQIIGTCGFFFLFCLKFYIVVVERAWQRAGRVAMLWTTLYIFFLFFLRLLFLLHIGTFNQVQIAGSITVFIPLLITLLHLFLLRKTTEQDARH